VASSFEFTVFTYRARPKTVHLNFLKPSNVVGLNLSRTRPLKSISAILEELAHRKDETTTVGDVMRKGGSRGHGLGLLMFALPETIPIPVPSLSTFLAVPLVLISGHLILFGEGRGIPKRIRERSLPASAIKKLETYVTPIFRTVERVSHPRWEALAERERLLGIACLVLSIILLLPIPFGNLPPALCLAAIAFGMIQRDGIVVALGLLGAFACLVATIYVVSMAGNLF
jgi:hypothetical protein